MYVRAVCTSQRRLLCLGRVGLGQQGQEEETKQITNSLAVDVEATNNWWTFLPQLLLSAPAMQSA